MLSFLIFTDTTRLKKPHELDGRDYHFVSRDEMEKGILLNRYKDFFIITCIIKFVSYFSINSTKNPLKILFISMYKHVINV